MPSLVKEISQGQTKSLEQGSQGGGQSRPSGSLSRVFRVVLSEPGESFSEEQVCGVSVGSPHPTESGYVCVSYSRVYDGESRMVVNVTFNYQLVQSQDQQPRPPDVRPARWTVSSSFYEAPVFVWRKRFEPNQWTFDIAAANPVGDIYDGVTAMRPMVTITATQFDPTDPTRHVDHVGSINEDTIFIGSLTMPPHTVMLRGVQATPVVENFGGLTYIGWNVSYELAYRSHKTRVNFGADGQLFQEIALGWDIAVPQTGFNVRAFDPQNPRADQDVYGQPLRHGKQDDPDFAGRIKVPLALPIGVEAGTKQRAMVRVFSYQNEGATQTPSAMPVPLNNDGTPRKIVFVPPENESEGGGGGGVRPLVYAYQVHKGIDLIDTLGLRFE